VSLAPLALRVKTALADFVTSRPREGETALAYLFRVDYLHDPGPHGTKRGVDPIDLSAVFRAGRWNVERDESADRTFIGVYRQSGFFSVEDGATLHSDGIKFYRSHAEDLWVRTRPWHRPFRTHLLPHERAELDALYARAYGARDDAPATREVRADD
jgi:hypothetical protein